MTNREEFFNLCWELKLDSVKANELWSYFQSKQQRENYPLYVMVDGKAYQVPKLKEKQIKKLLQQQREDYEYTRKEIIEWLHEQNWKCEQLEKLILQK